MELIQKLFIVCIVIVLCLFGIISFSNILQPESPQRIDSEGLKSIPRRLDDTHYLRSSKDTFNQNNNLLTDFNSPSETIKSDLSEKILSYGATDSNHPLIDHAIQQGIPNPPTIENPLRSHPLPLRLENSYTPEVFPKLRELESHILNENTVIVEYTSFQQDGMIPLFKKALMKGNLITCPEYQFSENSFGNNIYDGIEKAIEKFDPIYFLEFSTSSILTSVTNYISIQYPSLVSLLIRYERDTSAQSSSFTKKSEEDLSYLDCKHSFSSRNAFLITGESYEQTDITPLNETKNDIVPTINHTNCIQYLENYQLISQNVLLPFEYEREVGIFLCRCSVSYVPAMFPAEDPFFAHWESTTSLLKNSLEAADSCSKRKSITKSDSSESYASPVKSAFDVIMISDEESNGSSPKSGETAPSSIGTTSSSSSLSSSSSSSSSSYALSSAYLSRLSSSSSSSSSSLPSSSASQSSSDSPVEPPEDSFPWIILKDLALDSYSRIKYANKILYDNILNQEESDQKAKEEIILPDERNTTYPSRYIYIPSPVEQQLSEQNASTLDAIPISQVPNTTLITASVSNETLVPVLEANLNNTANAEPFLPSTNVSRRLLKSLTSSSSSYSSSKKSRSSSEDRLEATELNFAWKLLDEKHQFLDLLSPDHSPGIDAANPNKKDIDDEIHQQIVKYYSEILEEEKIDLTSTSSFSSYFLSDNSRTLQKAIYREEKLVYLRWMNLLHQNTEPTASESKIPSSQEIEGESYSLWKDVSSAKIIYSLSEKLSLTSLKLASLLSTVGKLPNTKKSQKRQTKQKQFNKKISYPANKNFLLLSFISNAAKAKAHYKLAKVMDIQNNLIFQPSWNMKLLLSWIGSPERGDVSLIESDIILAMISMIYEYSIQSHINGVGEEDINPAQHCSIDLMYEGLSVLFSLSTMSYIYLPDLKEFLMSLEIITPLCYDAYLQQNFIYSPSGSSSTASSSSFASIVPSPPPYQEFLQKIMSKLQFSFDITINDITVPPSPASEANKNDNFYRIYIKRRLPTTSKRNTLNFLSPLFETKTSTNGVSLYSIGNWNLIDKQKSKLFQLFINLPLWNLKEYFFHNKHGSSSSSSTYSADSFHTNYEHDQHINLHQLAPWNIYLNIQFAEYWELSILTLHQNQEDGRIISDSLISVTSEIPNREKTKKKKTVKPSRSYLSVQRSSFLKQEILSSQKIYDILHQEFQEHSSELANGYFSFLEHNSGIGYVSSRLSKRYPNATVFSIGHQASKSQLHYALSEKLQIQNNAICLQETAGSMNSDENEMYQNLYDCPELFRFQLLFNNLLENFIYKNSDLNDWGEHMGKILSSALTTFVYVPNPALVSYGLYTLFGFVLLYRDRKTEMIYTPADLVLLQQQQRAEEVEKVVGGVQEEDASVPYYKTIRPIIVEKKFPYRLLEEVVLQPDHHHVPPSLIDNIIPPHHDHQPKNNIQDYFQKLTYLSSHPQLPFQNFQSEWLLSSARIQKGFTSLLISPLLINDHTRSISTRRGMISQPIFLDFPMIRCDIINMTRHVHHHYQYSKDGHSRTYTMRIQVNMTETTRVKQTIIDPSTAVSYVDQTGVHLSLPSSVGSKDSILNADSNIASPSTITLALGHHPSQHNIVSVRLFRDKDDWPIPYVSIYGVTLITALRLGLLPQIRERFFHSFLKLPLYEDMAPWNIVLMGSNVDYIDYDTREFTFDNVIPKAYQVMTVLMNYKRTVEDFRKCGSKAGTVYGLPYVADCVGGFVGEKDLQCSSDLRYPVPCADGKCHSDYISCLRALSEIAQRIGAQSSYKHGQDPFVHEVVSSMSAVVAKFNHSSYSEMKYEDFLNQLSS